MLSFLISQFSMCMYSMIFTREVFYTIKNTNTLSAIKVKILILVIIVKQVSHKVKCVHAKVFVVAIVYLCESGFPGSSSPRHYSNDGLFPCLCASAFNVGKNKFHYSARVTLSGIAHGAAWEALY